MNLREAAQQALEALEIANNSVTPQQFFDEEIAALRAALAKDAMQRLTGVQQEIEATSQESRQVEPVAYVTGYSKGYATVRPIDPCLLMCVGMALYRSPPQRKPLTNDEIVKIKRSLRQFYKRLSFHKITRAIERAYGIWGEE